MFSDRLSRKRLHLCVALQSGQQLTGINVVMYYMPFISSSVGFGSSALLCQGVNGVVNFLSTFIAFFFVDRIGRRKILVAGAALMALMTALIGGLGLAYAK